MHELQRVRKEFSPIRKPLNLNWADAESTKLLVFALRVRDIIEKENIDLGS
jgi:hypothetical protein